MIKLLCTHTGPHTFYEGRESRTATPGNEIEVTDERGKLLLADFPQRFTLVSHEPDRLPADAGVKAVTDLAAFARTSVGHRDEIDEMERRAMAAARAGVNAPTKEQFDAALEAAKREIRAELETGAAALTHVHLVGRVDNPGDPKGWECMGVFRTAELAIDACADARDFVAELELDQRAPEFPAAFYPKSDVAPPAAPATPEPAPSSSDPSYDAEAAEASFPGSRDTGSSKPKPPGRGRH